LLRLPLRLSLFVTRTTSQEFGTGFSNFTRCCIRLIHLIMQEQPSTLPWLGPVLSGGQIWIGTVRYAEGLWRMRRHGPVLAHCTSTDSEDAACCCTVKVSSFSSADMSDQFGTGAEVSWVQSVLTPYLGPKWPRTKMKNDRIECTDRSQDRSGRIP